MIDTAPSPQDLQRSVTLLRSVFPERFADDDLRKGIAESYSKVADMLDALVPLAEHLAKMEEAGVDPSAALPHLLRQLGVG